MGKAIHRFKTVNDWESFIKAARFPKIILSLSYVYGIYF